MLLASSTDTGAILAAVIPTAVAILGGGLTMAWKLGSLSTRVDSLTEQLRGNTNRLDIIDAKADGAKEAASAAVAAATAVARSTPSSVRPA